MRPIVGSSHLLSVAWNTLVTLTSVLLIESPESFPKEGQTKWLASELTTVVFLTFTSFLVFVCFSLIFSFVNNTKKVLSGSRSKKWFKWRLTEGCRDSVNTRTQKYVNRLCPLTHILSAFTHFLLHTRIFHSIYAY